jgi:hypothetical protein
LLFAFSMSARISTCCSSMASAHSMINLSQRAARYL